MRLWSISPIYLDNKGLGGLWAESHLAKKVLLGNTKGYKHHPALIPFKNISETDNDKIIKTIDQYLFIIWEEAIKRGLKYKSTLLSFNSDPENYTYTIPITYNNLIDEFNILQEKLKTRNPVIYMKNYIRINNDLKNIVTNEVFYVL